VRKAAAVGCISGARGEEEEGRIGWIGWSDGGERRDGRQRRLVGRPDAGRDL
jgi:hypothetical protein